MTWCKVLAQWVRRFHIVFRIFHICHPFLSKCLLRMWKCRKLNVIRFLFLWWIKVSEAVCKRDWYNIRSYLFFNVPKILTKISDCLHDNNCTKNLNVFPLHFLNVLYTDYNVVKTNCLHRSQKQLKLLYYAWQANSGDVKKHYPPVHIYFFYRLNM